MGCQFSKNPEDEGGGGKCKKSKGNLDDPAPPPPSDPRLPLTARQKFNISKSWKGINRAMEETGVYMFLKLFEDHSELLRLFDKLKELKTRDAQAESMELAEHATIVMNSIDEGIKAMDNVDFFFDLLHQIGGTHHRIPGFKKEYFWKIENPFLEAVKMTLGDRYTDNMDHIYRITIKLIIETVIAGYEMEEERELKANSFVYRRGYVNATITTIKSAAHKTHCGEGSKTPAIAPDASPNPADSVVDKVDKVEPTS